ncbi:DUF397 domain-containing protein [Actinomadura sp. 7K507]|uniref:DUF397 domain-containing protein n=1 Tax=Actinomadura sp. 7K507 TaxID=2530365 RepID=UPI00104F7B93|nr:DUF397 domain-containing protein [Actinomadura sp. 7K507]TDC75076.1 DUF397 domain-containing protein [Actinomadura sp. 7K507]
MTKKFRAWRKSRHSDPGSGCVEAGRASDGTVGVRDSKLDRSPILEFTPAEWKWLLQRIRRAA